MAKQTEPSTPGTGPNTPDFRAFLDAGSWLSGWASFNQQMAAVVSGQMKQNVDACQALMATATFPPALTLQAEFSQTALRQCFDTSQKLLSLGTQAMIESWNAARAIAQAAPGAAQAAPGAMQRASD
jgi:hypothetical protein